MMPKGIVEIGTDITIQPFKDNQGHDMIIIQTYAKPGKYNIIQLSTEEAFKLAYALMSLASEL